MTIIVRPIEINEIQDVCDLLSTKFGTISGGKSVEAEVLHWKCFDSLGAVEIPRGFVATKGKNIIAYVGLCPLQFIGGGLTREVSAGHGIDWYASKEIVSAGLMVGGKSDECVEVSFSIGGTDLAIKIKKKLKLWKFLPPVANFYRDLCPAHHLRPPLRAPIWKCFAKVIRDYGRNVFLRRMNPSISMNLHQVESFGEEVPRIMNSCRMPEIHIKRTPGLLNHFLRYPKKNITGWHILFNGVVCGFALLSIIQDGNLRIGKIVDCCLDSLDPSRWQAALFILTEQLHRLSADTAVCYGSTPLIAQALEENGFICDKFYPFAIRDPQNILPEDASFYLTPLVADHAYLCI